MTVIVNNLSDFSASWDWDPPVTAGLEYFNFFGSGDLKRNLAPGKPSAAVAGSPVVGNGYAEFIGGTVYIDTKALESKDSTLILVASWPTPNPAGLHMGVSTYNGSSDAGVNLFYSGSADNFQASSHRSNSGTPVIQTATIPSPVAETDWHFLVGRNSDAAPRIVDLTKGADVSLTGTIYPRPANSGRSWRIGSSYSSAAGAGNMTRVSCAAIYSRVLSDGELTAIYDVAKTYAAMRSISI